MKVPVIDLSDCTTCGTCVEICPQVFRVAPAGYVEVIELSEYPRDEVDRAISYCPEDCIYWEESDLRV